MHFLARQEQALVGARAVQEFDQFSEGHGLPVDFFEHDGRVALLHHVDQAQVHVLLEGHHLLLALGCLGNSSVVGPLLCVELLDFELEDILQLL